eukprot:SAG31_NODE_249_length_19118_cov_47.456195_22_plen_102_part_00
MIIKLTQPRSMVPRPILSQVQQYGFSYLTQVSLIRIVAGVPFHLAYKPTSACGTNSWHEVTRYRPCVALTIVQKAFRAPVFLTVQKFLFHTMMNATHFSLK